jgi:sigma-B regulation protein RsbU (phosphoserine phosphatase)
VVDHATFEDTTLRLDPGDALLLYTDGVTEARHRRDFYGEQRLTATATRAGPEPVALVDALVREVLEFQDGTLRDDVAVIAFGPPA